MSASYKALSDYKNVLCSTTKQKLKHDLVCSNRKIYKEFTGDVFLINLLCWILTPFLVEIALTLNPNLCQQIWQHKPPISSKAWFDFSYTISGKISVRAVQKEVPSGGDSAMSPSPWKEEKVELVSQTSKKSTASEYPLVILNNS